MHACNVFYGTVLSTLQPGQLLLRDVLPAQWRLLNGCKFYTRHSLLFLKSYQCAFVPSSHGNVNPLIYSTELFIACHLYLQTLPVNRQGFMPYHFVFIPVRRYANLDALRATFIHNCHHLFVQVPFRVQGCAILQNRVYLIATVILDLHALTVMMCCGQKFTNHVAEPVVTGTCAGFQHSLLCAKAASTLLFHIEHLGSKGINFRQ